MQIKVTKKDSFSLIEILGDNGEPASPQNPINEQEEIKTVEFPEGYGTLAVVSGMPASALVMVSCYYKNRFGAIAISNPRLGVALVVHSTNRTYPLGTSIPLG